jgi:hypothetical protein
MRTPGDIIGQLALDRCPGGDGHLAAGATGVIPQLECTLCLWNAIGEAQKEALEAAADICADEMEEWANLPQRLDSPICRTEASIIRNKLLELRGTPSIVSEVKRMADPHKLATRVLGLEKKKPPLHRTMDLE